MSAVKAYMIDSGELMAQAEQIAGYSCPELRTVGLLSLIIECRKVAESYADPERVREWFVEDVQEAFQLKRWEIGRQDSERGIFRPVSEL